MKKISIGIVLSLAICVSLIYISTERSIAYAINGNLSDMMLQISEKSEKDPSTAMSSNPYDYIKGNQHYQAIVSLGEGALLPIEDKIVNSKNDGLEEYILAIAAEEIAKIDLKNDKSSDVVWETGKGWANEWAKHLKAVPAKVHKIAISSLSKKEKLEKLVTFGTPAIPFILDEIEIGTSDIAGALEILLTGNNEVSFDAGKVHDPVSWSKENKVKFESLRRLVMSHQ